MSTQKYLDGGEKVKHTVRRDICWSQREEDKRWEDDLVLAEVAAGGPL
jgi:hypothetical protein